MNRSGIGKQILETCSRPLNDLSASEELTEKIFHSAGLPSFLVELMRAFSVEASTLSKPAASALSIRTKDALLISLIPLKSFVLIPKNLFQTHSSAFAHIAVFSLVQGLLFLESFLRDVLSRLLKSVVGVTKVHRLFLECEQIKGIDLGKSMSPLRSFALAFAS